MASSVEFVEYVCGQLSEAGKMRYKKMFGEYGIYCDEKFIGLICENQFFVKKTVKGATLLRDAEEVSPYSGAKPHFVIESLDDKIFLSEFIRATYEELPMPKPKK